MNKGKLAAIMAMAMMSSGGYPFAIREDETPEQIKARSIRFKEKKIRQQGLKEFEINGHKIMALNYKNALRKVNKLTQ